MAEELLCAPRISSMASPSAPAAEYHDFADLDLESFLLSSPSPTSPSSASAASSPSTRIPNRSHPPPRHRRCLFGISSPPADIPLVSKLPRPTPFLTPSSDTKSCRKRGAYNCGRCGQPKRGHVCEGEAASPKALVIEQHSMTPRKPHLQAGSLCFVDHQTRFNSVSCSPFPRSKPSSEASLPVSSSSLASSCSSNERSKRALQHLTTAAASESADASVVADADASIYSDNSSYERELEYEAMPLSCLVQILSRLFPQDLLAASSVCRRWRQCAEYAWAGLRKPVVSIKAANFSRVDVDGDSLPYILRKCSNLQQLTLDVSSHLGDRLLQCIFTLSRNLSALEISLKPGGVNTISGEGMRDLFRHCRSLTSVKFEGCDRVFEVELSSPCLATLWLTGCHHLKYMFLDCPDLSELCLDFMPGQDVVPSEQDHGKSDSLAAIIQNIGNTARGLVRLHVASPWLQDRVVHGLFNPGLKSLRMLSLTFGLGITDHSVDAIAANCEKLELLDLSGSSITDLALELICKSFSTSLSKLLIALCPRVSQAGLQMVVSELPNLQLLDCGKVITDRRTYTWPDHADGTCLTEPSHLEGKSGGGKLRLHHQQLQKLSFWGCTGLEELALDCPNLVDLNLMGCSKLQSGGLQLICPSLKDVYVAECEEELVYELHNQLELAHFDPITVWRGKADGSKRVQALNLH